MEEWYRDAARANEVKQIEISTVIGADASYEFVSNRAELEDFITYLYGLANEAFGAESDGVSVDLFEPSGWWRIINPKNGSLWMEASSETEVRAEATAKGWPLQRYYKRREDGEWRDE